MSERKRSHARRPLERHNQEPQPSTSKASTPVLHKEKKIKLNVEPDSQSLSTCQGRKNPFQIPKIIETLGQWAPQTVIAKLKTMSPEHYHVLKPIHLKNAKKTLLIQNNEAWNSFVPKTKKKKVQCSTTVGRREMVFTALNWRPDLAEAFKKLVISSMFPINIRVRNTRFQKNCGYNFVLSLIEQLYPYVTKIEVCSLSYSQAQVEPGKKYAEFWNKFPKLTLIKLFYENLSNLFTETQFKIMLQTLRPEIQIKLMTGRMDDLEDILDLVSTSGLNADRVKAHQELVEAEDHDRLEEIAFVCSIYRELLEDVSLRILVTEDNFEDNQRFLGNLTELSPFLTHLTYTCLEINDCVLDGDILWPKLRSLVIDRYTKPLDILKKCPKLEKLHLMCNQTTCIFHTTNLSDHESIREYFSNLSQLKKLTIRRKWWPWDNQEDFKIYAGSSLEVFLMSVLPKGVKLMYGQ